MKKIGIIFKGSILGVMLIASAYWLYSVLLHLVEKAGWISIGYVALLVGILFIVTTKRRTIILDFILRHKSLIFIAMLAFQLAILFSTNLMIRSDAAMVFNGAFNFVDSTIISRYLSENPNNLFLFLYERFFFQMFGFKGIWAMQLLNILYVNLAIVIFYGVAKRHFSEQVADYSFLFYCLLIGFSPQFVAMYTDVMVLPLIAIQLYLLLELLQLKSLASGKVLWLSFALALISAVGMLIRPTMMILVLALFIILFLQAIWRKFFLLCLGFMLGFGLFYSASNVLMKSQNQVEVIEGRGKTALAFIDLGLTYIGTDQIDFQAGLSTFVTEETRVDANYDGRYSNEVVLKDIKRRLDEYTFSTFVGHLLMKAKLTVQDGTFGWTYKDASKEGAFFINPLYSQTEQNQFAQFIRKTFIYTDEKEYIFSTIYLQLIYSLLVIGLVVQFFRFGSSDKEFLLSLAVFGGLLFLMIFEGGKTRYLIQFLPQILLLASLGWDRILPSKKVNSEFPRRRRKNS
ncbi:TPA: glycosyltransferase family 39 protein [Streptococcus suis]|nr:glycosyltransferase family 39 protein [Streptococcus suis]HEL1583369.1 glycosyltransferase family 39 protein [Streptococcus suis]